MFTERYSYLKSHNYEYFTIGIFTVFRFQLRTLLKLHMNGISIFIIIITVIEDTKKSRVVGAGTIFVERKFVHAGGLVNIYHSPPYVFLI